MALGSIVPDMLGLRRKDDALFTPRMPEVDTPATMAALFDTARSTAAEGARTGGDSARRSVVIVTPGRLLMLQPCPSPGSMSENQVASMQQLLPGPRRHVVAIGYTELAAVQSDLAKAIPFIGMLLGLAYIGHAVWLFEGHPSALVDGSRNADLMLVDGAMIPHLQPDWQVVAGRAMRRPEIYVHDRRTFRLSRAPQMQAVS
jgi:hypothetical protein